MSGSFGTDTQALAFAASAFQAQADPTIQQAERRQREGAAADTAGDSDDDDPQTWWR